MSIWNSIVKQELMNISMLTEEDIFSQATIQDNARQGMFLFGGIAQAGQLAREGHVPHLLETGPQVGVRVNAPLEC